MFENPRCSAYCRRILGKHNTGAALLLSVVETGGLTTKDPA